jgi:multidrug efflux pump subunit AcrA (membrane-fusion protein)
MSGSRKIWLIVGILLAAGLVGMAATARWTSTATESESVPVIQVKRGDFDPKIFATGELRASHLSMLSAPQIGGGTLQITRLLGTGSRIKKGDLVVEFDPTEQQFKFEQSQSELQQADQEIIKAKADTAVQAATDKVALLKARFDLRTAQLEIEKNELLSAIDAKKNELALEQAKRVLDQLEQDIKSHTASGAASIGLAQEKRHKAQLSMEQAKQNIEKMEIFAPMDGVVAIEKNMDSSGGMFWGGMSVPDYREGDQAYPGRTIAQVIDPNDMEISAKLNERDRNNVKVGQRTEITLDALPGQVFDGVVKTVGGMSSRNIFDDEQGGHFEITVRIPTSDPRLRAGFTAQVEVVGDALRDVLYVPRQAVFMNNGKRIVYVIKGNDFEAREIKITTETESQAVVEGLSDGTKIALVNPNLSKPSASSPSAQAGMGAGIH